MFFSKKSSFCQWCLKSSSEILQHPDYDYIHKNSYHAGLRVNKSFFAKNKIRRLALKIKSWVFYAIKFTNLTFKNAKVNSWGAISRFWWKTEDWFICLENTTWSVLWYLDNKLVNKIFRGWKCRFFHVGNFYGWIRDPNTTKHSSRQMNQFKLFTKIDFWHLGSPWQRCLCLNSEKCL